MRKAVETRPPQPEKPPEPVPEPEEKPAAAPPEDAKPVDLPDQPAPVVDEEKVKTPETDIIAPEKDKNPEPVNKPEPREETVVKPLGGGAQEGKTGNADGDPGDGTADARTAPFQIEGLNRVPVSTTLPVYAAQVNAVISVRVTVDPQGRIIRRIPLRKGNPELEKAVLDALQRWRFNPLPANAPRESQTGIITFRFRLE